ncbi:SCO family protein [Myroides sp. 1354]|uniref:SCO family protein n=1 Tax=unclassified Myroides TaxID=2642485 RepID=UPI0025788117|nr:MULTISPECIES: SCO family protein [unclassified Myroides]MDM1044592.1 SCO family protein [Myroides sp. R163-1]MDM1055305.1 SCO family protein [Myroides sp. 1354]MDM1068602.1 SCO family protein [Myroides sp. 1372]
MKRVFLFLVVSFFVACSKEAKPLPYLGNHTEKVTAAGERKEVYYQIPSFSLLNQDSLVVSNQTLAGKIYITDFIFLQCPTICPKMNLEMKRVYDAYQTQEDVLFVSHTIDPKNDSIPVLKAYSESIGVQAPKWQFLHGDEQVIHQLAQSYFMQAYQENNAPGGYAHSGGFLLIDGNQHIRGVYDGTNTADVDRLIQDISQLLQEKK